MTIIDHRNNRRNRYVGTSDDGAYDHLGDWSDQQLEGAYYRLSHDLRRRGFEVGTVHRMGCVEVELRRRGADVDQIAREVTATHEDHRS